MVPDLDLDLDLDLERDGERETSFLLFFASFLLFLGLGLRLRLWSLFFWLRSSSSFLPLALPFLLRDLLRERDAATLDRERLRLLLALRLLLLRDLRLLERDLDRLRLRE